MLTNTVKDLATGVPRLALDSSDYYISQLGGGGVGVIFLFNTQEPSRNSAM